MKYLHLCSVLLVIGCFVVDIQSLPIENEPEQQQPSQIAVILPEYILHDLPAKTESPEESVVAAVPLSLLDVEKTDKSSSNISEDSQRSARGLGGLGGFGGKFGGLGLGFKSFGGFGHLGFGGLHGLGGGFGGFKSLFGKHFG